MFYYNKKREVVELCPGKLATATMSPQVEKTNLESGPAVRTAYTRGMK